METTSMIENYTAAYMPEEETHDLIDEGLQDTEVRVVNPYNLDIVNYRGIPSTINLMKAEASPPEELDLFKKRHIKLCRERAAETGKPAYIEDFHSIDPTDDPDQILKAMIET